MADSDDITDAIVDSTQGPKRVVVNGMGESEEHSIPDQIAGARHVANARAASAANGFGLRFAKMNPPGAQ